MVSTLEQMQVPNGTGPGVRRSKRPLLANRTRCNVFSPPHTVDAFKLLLHHIDTLTKINASPHTVDAFKLLLHHIDTLTKINVKIDKCELPTFYWLPKLHKNPFKSRFISNSSHCSTTILSKHITSALTAIKDHVIKYSETAFSNSNVNYFWSIKRLFRGHRKIATA